MISQLGDLTVISAFVIWFLLSVGNQIGPVADKLARFDRFGFLPRWTFFAPNPGIYDHHLVFRECGAEVDVSSVDRLEAAAPHLSAWLEVSDLYSGRSFPFLWNPQRRLTKTISDVVNGLVIARNRFSEKPDVVQFTVEYFLLLHLVQRGAAGPSQRQFAIVRTHGFTDDRQTQLVFLSNFHPVGAHL
jgi:hypothetical protein